MVDIGKSKLVAGLEHEWIMTFHSVGNFMIPTDELKFFRGVETIKPVIIVPNDSYNIANDSKFTVSFHITQ